MDTRAAVKCGKQTCAGTQRVNSLLRCLCDYVSMVMSWIYCITEKKLRGGFF